MGKGVPEQRPQQGAAERTRMCADKEKKHLSRTNTSSDALEEQGCLSLECHEMSNFYNCESRVSFYCRLSQKQL